MERASSTASTASMENVEPNFKGLTIKKFLAYPLTRVNEDSHKLGVYTLVRMYVQSEDGKVFKVDKIYSHLTNCKLTCRATSSLKCENEPLIDQTIVGETYTVENNDTLSFIMRSLPSTDTDYLDPEETYTAKYTKDGRMVEFSVPLEEEQYMIDISSEDSSEDFLEKFLKEESENSIFPIIEWLFYKKMWEIQMAHISSSY